MKVTYIKLENVAGLIVGSNRSCIEIDFTKGYNKIVSIQAANSKGKSVLLSSINPFSYVTSIDDRSSLSYIAPHKNGYKEIHYQDGDDKYVIKHHFKAVKDSHTVKSYFMKNGEELNDNGNVTSFNQLVEIHMGLTSEMMRLLRLGTNVNSFVSLTPTRRKEYIGKLISELDAYGKIYKKINDDIKIMKAMLQTNNNNLASLHIENIDDEEYNLKIINKEIKSIEKDRDKTLLKIGNIDSMINETDVDTLKHQQHDAEAALRELERIKIEIQERQLEGILLGKLIEERNKVNNEKLNVQSLIHSYRLNIDAALTRIDQISVEIKKITSGNNIQSLIDIIKSLERVNDVSRNILKNFRPLQSSSEEVYRMFSMLNSLNSISQNILTLGNKPLDIYLKLKDDNVDIDRFIIEQSKKSISGVNKSNISVLMSQLFGNDDIISPNCATEYLECPYYRLAESIDKIKDEIDKDLYDLETLNYIRIINANVEKAMNEIASMRNIEVPDLVKEALTERAILQRLKKHLPFFDLTNLSEYLSMLKEYEIYKENCKRLDEYQYQLSIYHKSGIDSQQERIKTEKALCQQYQIEIKNSETKLESLNKQLNEIDEKIALVTKYDNAVKHRKMYEDIVKFTKKKISPLETAEQERIELNYHLRELDVKLNNLKEQQKSLESRINEYKKLSKEGAKLSDEYKNRLIVLEAVSTKKGIPVIYMKKYLDKIKTLANRLLDIIYDGSFQLGNFQVTTDTFEIPFVRNDRPIPDIKYGSQSEIALSTMALSFALAINTSTKYNVLLLDEIDAGLDENNRSLFIDMLREQMHILKSEQLFVISHNLSQMKEIPMDCIKLSDINIKSKLHNVIFE